MKDKEQYKQLEVKGTVEDGKISWKDKELEEQIEELAAIEHERWADWQRWCNGEIRANANDIESPLRRWDKQIETPYEQLSEREKDSDREQVDRYWQLITAYTNKQIEAVLDRLELSMRGKTIVDTAEGWQKFVKRHVVASIEAERNKLNSRNYDTYRTR